MPSLLGVRDLEKMYAPIREGKMQPKFDQGVRHTNPTRQSRCSHFEYCPEGAGNSAQGIALGDEWGRRRRALRAVFPSRESTPFRASQRRLYSNPQPA